MTLNEKIELIKEFKEPAIAALNNYLDLIYDLNEKYFDEEGSLKEGLKRNEKIEKFIKDLKDDSAVKYEAIRHKLIKDDFNLSLFEVNLIASVFIYVKEVWIKDIKKLEGAVKEAEGVIEKLLSTEEKN